MRRSTAFGRALLFLLVTSPIWAFRQAYAVFHPVAVLALALAVTLLFLWWDRRSPEVLGLDPRPRRLVELGGGPLGGAVLIGVMALLLAAVLPFPWKRNAGFRAGVAAWSLVYLLSSNAVEELVFRGYGFDRMMAAIGLWPAQILTALVFAVFHVVQTLYAPLSLRAWMPAEQFTARVVVNVVVLLACVAMAIVVHRHRARAQRAAAAAAV
ncbi:MAG TPA: CPBP family intramembrane glutamic endopeptidase [Gemmatimonadaceae bacterium]|nr:CPBP family intramembrane glutamic endopeptidase [Gemmatimonadaceae bacterium]